MNILFLCVANSARSQMAEGLARNLFGINANISSAGSEPTKVNPYAIVAMNKIGIDISTQCSKPIDIVFNDDIDLIITLCADEICPIGPHSTKKEHWPFSDPASILGSDKEILAGFEITRDQIMSKLVEFGKEHGLLRSGKMTT